MDRVRIIKRKRKSVISIQTLSCFVCNSTECDLRTAIITVGEERRQIGDTSHVDVQHRLSMISGKIFMKMKLDGTNRDMLFSAQKAFLTDFVRKHRSHMNHLRQPVYL